MNETTEQVARKELLTAELKTYMDEKKDMPGTLIMVLHRVQEHFGYVPRDVAFEVADAMHIPVAKVYGVLTFYNFFRLTQPGKHQIAVCMGTACYLKGAQDLIDELENLLGTPLGDVTPDGEFSLEAVRCLGCCGLAPVLTVDGEVFGNVRKDDLPDILARYKGREVEPVAGS